VPAVPSPLYPYKAAGVFFAIWSVVLLLRAQQPAAPFGPANIVTTARAALVALVAGLIGEMAAPNFAMTAAAAGTLSVLLDGLDGWLARRTKMTSAFGARYDMEVDALLILALSIVVWQQGKAGAWVVASGLERYAFVAAGWIWSWMRQPLPRSQRARIVCVAQIAGLIASLLPAITWPASAVIAAAALAALTWSFAVDVHWLWRQASDH